MIYYTKDTVPGKAVFLFPFCVYYIFFFTVQILEKLVITYIYIFLGFLENGGDQSRRQRKSRNYAASSAR